MTPIRPEFTNPPLIERALTVAFSPIELFSLGSYGLFWSEIRAEFPECQAMPPVQLEIERFDGFTPRTAQIQLVGADMLPRAFFRNSERGELVQVQPDRFSFNWIKMGSDHAYPHSEAVLQRFFDLLDRFEQFLIAESMGALTIVQCELTNVNVVPLTDVGDAFADVATVVRLAQLDDRFENLQLESQFGASKHLLLDDSGQTIGRVHTSGQPSLQADTGDLAFRLDVVARGAPMGMGREGIERFFHHAVSGVNAAFLASVTHSGRQFWGEIDGK